MGWFRALGRRFRAFASISDPALLERLGISPPVHAGVEVTEASTVGLSGVWRAMNLIAGTLASLPLGAWREYPDGRRQRLPSVLDEPGGPDGPSRYEWVETILCHLILHGNAYLLHRYNMAGGLRALEPLHPCTVTVERWVPTMGGPRPPGERLYRVVLDDGTTETLTARALTHIPAVSLDGITGLGLLSAARQNLGCGIAGEYAAARAFSNGGMIQGVVTPEDELADGDDEFLQEEINRQVTGWEHNAAIRVFNRRLKFSPWSVSPKDAQFLESRQFSIEDIARWTGVPPFALMQTTKQTSWGTGIAEQQRGLSRTVLAPWAARLVARLSRLLPRLQVAAFDFEALERPNPETEDQMLLARVAAGVMTRDEYRARRGLPPLDSPDPAEDKETDGAAV